MTLSPVMRRFILHWGEMGTRWGVNRTVAQIHALLYLSPRPLPAEIIARTLSVARSNVSTSLRELQNWRLIRVVHVLGDRRDHVECVKGVWDLFQHVVEERKRREIDPTVEVLRECLRELARSGSSATYTAQRLQDMLELFEAATAWYGQLCRLPSDQLRRFAKLSGRAQWLLERVSSRRSA